MRRVCGLKMGCRDMIGYLDKNGCHDGQAEAHTLEEKPFTRSEQNGSMRRMEIQKCNPIRLSIVAAIGQAVWRCNTRYPVGAVFVEGGRHPGRIFVLMGCPDRNAYSCMRIQAGYSQLFVNQKRSRQDHGRQRSKTVLKNRDTCEDSVLRTGRAASAGVDFPLGRMSTRAGLVGDRLLHVYAEWSSSSVSTKTFIDSTR